MKKFLAIIASLATMFSMASCDNISSSTPPISSNSFNSSNTSSTSSSSSNLEFTSDNYKLEISAKEEYTPHQNNKKKTRHIKRANGNTDKYSWSGNALVITLDDEDIYQLNSLDSFIGQNSAPAINGRILTAPSDASVVQVMGINLLDSDEEVVAPNQFQEIEFDANGIYGSVIGTNYQSIDLSYELAGVIQPRSIKTKTFSSDVGFNIARSNVYLINGNPSNYIDEKTSYKNFASYVTNIDTLKMLLIDRISTAYIDLSPSLINTYFSVTINNLESVHLNDANYAYVPQHVQFTIEAINGEFSYSGEFWFELYDDQPPQLYSSDGTLIQNTSNLGLKKYSEYFVQDEYQFWTYNTSDYLLEILQDNFVAKTPSGLSATIESVRGEYFKFSGDNYYEYYYPIITLVAENGQTAEIHDKDELFLSTDDLFTNYSDGVYTYTLETDYYTGEKFYVITGFDIESGYNPFEHDFDLLFDCEYHENKIDLGNLGEVNGNYVYPVKGVDIDINEYNDANHKSLGYHIAYGSFKHQYHIDFRGCEYFGDNVYICVSNGDVNNDANYQDSYVILNGFPYNITSMAGPSFGFYSRSAYVFYPREQITYDYYEILQYGPHNLLFGENSYTGASREEILDYYERYDQSNSFPVDINSIPDDHFNTTPEYMLSQIGK